MLKYCKSLKFEEDPKYDYLKNLIKEALINQGITYDLIFDWVLQLPGTNKNPFLFDENDEPFDNKYC